MNEPKYITELKELCAKNARFKIADEIHELLSVEKQDENYFLNFHRIKGKEIFDFKMPLTFENSQKYLELTTQEKTALFIKGLLFLYVEKLLEQKGTIRQSQADILIKSFTDEIVKAFKTPLSQKDIEKIVAKIESELEKC